MEFFWRILLDLEFTEESLEESEVIRRRLDQHIQSFWRNESSLREPYELPPEIRTTVKQLFPLPGTCQ